MESQLGLIEQSLNSSYSLWVREALDEIPDNFTITDPCICGHPIVFVSRGFLKMTGYSKNEVIGKNGRVFQGPKTCRRSVMEVREAVREERAIQLNLLNYRKDGRPFWMLFHMCPVFSKEDGRVINFIAVQVPLSRKARRSGSVFCRNGVILSGEGSMINDVVYGSCRKEVRSDSLLELGPVLALDSALDSDVTELEIEEPCEASDLDKIRAASAINRVLSVLTHYSESTGRLVCGKRCYLSALGLLSSSLTISLGRIKQSFVLTDPHLPDMPIVYASDAFLKLTGYSGQEVLGHNCRFLNGEDTDSSTLYQIEESIKMEQACTVRILNYRKDKSSFWNSLHISPVRNASGKIAYFVGVHMEESCNDQGGRGLSPEMRQLSTVGAVKIAVRSSSMGAGSSKS
ncbi:Nitrogen fixation negative regulator NifL [Parasponia andersonii]|uniref:Nitrogen fixation negative regulator NifL n=1 Tax=Parasponia andersonii TaxID=3476 RepID=A0A2P5D2I1_PARAD|nr:Nitrogen fixation negative regulator NifL [Parasponia andersonii]